MSLVMDLNQWVVADYSGFGSVPDLVVYLIPRKIDIWWLRGNPKSGLYLVVMFG